MAGLIVRPKPVNGVKGLLIQALQVELFVHAYRATTAP